MWYALLAAMPDQLVGPVSRLGHASQQAESTQLGMVYSLLCATYDAKRLLIIALYIDDDFLAQNSGLFLDNKPKYGSNTMKSSKT